MNKTDLAYLDLTAIGFSTRGEEVLAARDDAWCARTPHGIAVLRNKHAGLLLRDRRLRQGSHAWPNMMALEGSFADFWQRSVISQEGDTHKRLRAAAQAALREEYILQMKPAFSKIAGELCDGLQSLEWFDIVDGFTEPFAGRAIALLLGEPDKNAATIAADASALGLAMGPEAKRHEERTNAACDRLSGLAKNLLDALPGEGFIARLMGTPNLDRQALIDLIVISIFGGVDTTRAQLAFAAWLFAQHPDQWTWLRAHPEAIPNALDEVIRMRPTTTWATREALVAFEFDGVKVRKGETLHILVHASGTDPLTGHDGKFDITRPTKRHFGFGGGAHHCLGHFVARTDMAAALEVWLQRWQRIEIVGEPTFLPDTGNTSPTSLQIRPEWA